jgi:hypothetical protein
MLTLTLKDSPNTGSVRPISAAAVVDRLAPGGKSRIPGIDSAVILNDYQVRLFTTASQDTVLRALAHPGFALPEGIPMQGPQRATMLDMPPLPGQPELQFRFSALDDPRDALDRGADLMVSRDPALLEYAARRPELAVHPLPWNRTYVLVQPAPAPPLPAVITESERQSLARDAVQADARAANPPFWWVESSCPPGAAPAAGPLADRIVYPSEDEVARALAERLVALAGPGTRLRAAGLSHSQLAAALREETELAYVLSLSKQALEPCRELPAFPVKARIQPLIETRASAIVRRGAPPLTVDWDGTIRVVRP